MIAPLSALYRLGDTINRALQRSYKSSIPVLCVGNPVAGGSGKTPCALALIALLKAGGIAQKPVVLTRGYKGRIKGPVVVGADHTVDDVGDEALLHARTCATIVSRNRAAGARLAESFGADIIVMDDGLQNGTIHKTITLLVVDGEYGFGNGRILPAGPMREPLSNALERTDAIILTSPRSMDRAVFGSTPVFTASMQANPPANRKERYVAFAGLGRPEKFKKTLEGLGMPICGWHPFPDHHPYTEGEIAGLIEEAAGKKAALITTEKDHVRLPEAVRGTIDTLPVRMVFDDEDGLTLLLKAGLT